MNSPKFRGEPAKMRDNSGDTVKALLDGGPLDSDWANVSPQLRMRAPTGIKESAIALAPTRRMNVPLNNGFDGDPGRGKKAAGRQATPNTLDSNKP